MDDVQMFNTALFAWFLLSEMNLSFYRKFC